MIEKHTVDMLNENGVSVSRQAYVEYMGQQYPIGEIWRRAYVNSAQGRKQVTTELPSAQLNAIMAVWGDTPTVDESGE